VSQPHPHWQRYFVSANGPARQHLADTASIAIAGLSAIESGPRTAKTPLQLHEAIWNTPICPDFGIEAQSVFAELSENVWANGVIPFDVACVAHLHPPATVAAAVTDLMIGATNQSMDSWDQAPAATEVELHLMSWLANEIGFGAEASGIMTSGGTASNVLAITLARSWVSAAIGVDVLKTGLPPEATSWRILCADQAHFSIQRAAGQLGLGRDAVITIDTLDSGHMDVEALDRVIADCVAQGQKIIAIVGTAGTTDLGVIDPFVEIAARATAIGAWFHVDAAVAGSFVLSEKLKSRLTGIALADSVTMDFHKLWWQSFNASALIVKDASVFDLLRVKSSYLDRGDELEGMINLVGRSLDTSRRFDAAKVVASLRTIGRNDFAAMLEYLVDVTAYATQRINDSDKLSMVASSDAVMCVFDVPGATADDLRYIQQKLLANGEMVLGRTTIKGRPALKFTFMNPLITYDDVDALIDVIVTELRYVLEVE
jgi:L-2,4-diaminobutyrate decarboxylase